MKNETYTKTMENYSIKVVGSEIQNNNGSIAIRTIVSPLFLLLFVFYCISLQSSYANGDNPQSVPVNDDVVQGIVNPFDSDCYDWRGKVYSM